MNIDDLNTSISEMSDEELFNLLNNIRSSRRKQPEKKTTTKNSNKAKTKKSSNTKILETMSKEEKLKLLEELTNES